MTRYFNFQTKMEQSHLQECAKILQNDGIIVFPTETVYGIGANALSKEAVEKIYLAKGRPSDNPLIVHIANKTDIVKIATVQNEIEQKLIDTFMPGPFTLILKKKNIIPDIVSANLETVGIRIPEGKIAKKLIEAAKVPIAAPSANISGRPSGTRLEDIKDELDGKVDAMIDGGNVNIGLESTVVKVIDNIPTILRPGKITKEEIEKQIGCCQISQNVMEKIDSKQKVESPGMKYRHYAPKTKCILVVGTQEEQIQKIKNQIKQKCNVCVLGFREHKPKIRVENFIEVGSLHNLEEISQNLFASLRQADKLGVECIFIEGVKEEQLGLAIMNRLIRTCQYHIL